MFLGCDTFGSKNSFFGLELQSTKKPLLGLYSCKNQQLFGLLWASIWWFLLALTWHTQSTLWSPFWSFMWPQSSSSWSWVWTLLSWYTSSNFSLKPINFNGGMPPYYILRSRKNNQKESRKRINESESITNHSEHQLQQNNKMTSGLFCWKVDLKSYRPLLW